MKQKAIAFQFERCLETNAHAQKLSRTFFRHGYSIHIVTDLPEAEYADYIFAFALKHGIRRENILFRKPDCVHNPVELLKPELFFSANPFEVRALNEGTPRPVACYLPAAAPAV